MQFKKFIGTIVLFIVKCLVKKRGDIGAVYYGSVSNYSKWCEYFCLKINHLTKKTLVLIIIFRFLQEHGCHGFLYIGNAD